jgi:L-threonylcarbamoyladenylate synthase
VVFPTETVYGLGADALSETAVARIFHAKGRPTDHPLIVHLAEAAMARALADRWPQAADCLAQAFWPGPLTLIVHKSPRVPLAVTGGQDSVGLRVPRHPVAHALLKAFAAQGSGAVAAPSANRFGQVSATRAQDVLVQLSPFMADTDLILDGGPCTEGLESTVVDCTAQTPRILRPGILGREAIAAALTACGLRLEAPLQKTPDPALPRVSGSLDSHYAPRTPLWVLPAAALRVQLHHYLAQHPQARVAAWMLSDWSDAPAGVTIAGAPTDPVGYGRLLYAQLNDWDRAGFDLLCLEAPPPLAAWEAVHDRLRRAAF